MREIGPPSEIRQLVGPLTRFFDGAWQRMHWWIATMAVLYAFSGITIVRPDEAAVILRWGHLVGSTPALQEHGSGLLFAFPRPIDQVVRVQVKHVLEVRVETLNNVGSFTGAFDNTLDPVFQGYALTGDQNIVHVEMMARYRISKPAEWAFYGPKSQDILRVEITSAMVRSLGEMGVDRVLSDGRKSLIEIASKRTQEGLDAAHSGLELSSLELTLLSPPKSLASDFEAVQSAFIGAQTQLNSAEAYVQSELPKAHADADAAVEGAQGVADADLANAKGESEAFLALYKEYRANPAVVRERLYRDAVDQAIAASGDVRWIPPPTDGKYNGFRISFSPSNIPREEPASSGDVSDSITSGGQTSPPEGVGDDR